MLCELIGISTEVSLTEDYIRKPDCEDLRYLIEVKKARELQIKPYTQVLQAHHGF